MKKIIPALLVGAALLAGFVTSSTAAPTSADAPVVHPYHLKTVSWIVSTKDDLKVDDQYVTLVGHCTGRTGGESFFFTDGTGSIRLDSADFELPIGPRIVIGGRIDQAYFGFGHLEVDVRNWHYAKR